MATSAERAMTKLLLDKYNKSIKPVQNASKAKSSQFSGIKNSIANISPGDFTPVSDFQTATDTALDDAFKSSAWLTADDAADKIQEIQNQCDYLGQLGIVQAIDKMASGIASEAIDAAKAAIDAARTGTGLSMPEFDIGEQLSDLVNKGVTALEPVRKELSGTVDAILETGKGVQAKASELVSQVGGAVSDAVGLASKGLSTLAGPLKELDKLINCVDTIGGVEFVTEADEMIDALNTVYDELGVKDDPAQRDFGEFDSDGFFSTLGLTSDQQDNILKAVNMNDQSKNNAQAVVTAAKKKASKAEVSESSLGGNTTENISSKVSTAEERAKVEFETSEVPSGAPPEPAEPTPTPVKPDPIATTVAPQPTGTPYWDFFEYPEGVNLPAMTEYLAYDPGQNGFPEILKPLFKKVPEGETTKSSTNRLRQGFTVVSTVVTEPGQSDPDSPSGVVQWTRIEIAVVIYLYKDGEAYDSGFSQYAQNTWESKKVDQITYKTPTTFGLSIQIPRVVAQAIRDLTEQWTVEQVESLL